MKIKISQSECSSKKRDFLPKGSVFLLLLLGMGNLIVAQKASGSNDRASARQSLRPSATLLWPSDNSLRCSENQKAKFDFMKEQDLNHRSEANKLTRIHFAFETGFFYSRGSTDVANIYRQIGFGDREEMFNFENIFSKWPSYSSQPYPRRSDGRPYFSKKSFQIGYSLSRNIALSLIYTHLGTWACDGFKILGVGRGAWNTYRTIGSYIVGDFRGEAYYIALVWTPIPKDIINGISLNVEAGFGLSNIHYSFVGSYPQPYSFTIGITGLNSVDLFSAEQAFSKNSPSLIVGSELCFWLFRNLSLGFQVDYKYVPYTITPFQLRVYGTSEYVVVDFPRKRAESGGFGLGGKITIHL